MEGGDILTLILVMAMLLASMGANMYTVGIEKIKKDWPKYRCNPAVMPLAGIFGHNPILNFVQCLTQVQKSEMTKYMNPLNHVMSIFEMTIESTLDSMNSTRGRMFSLASGTLGIFTQLFAAFGNVGVSFRDIIMRLNDTMAKMFGAVLIMAHMTEGAMTTGESIWNGPVGQSLRTAQRVSKTVGGVTRTVNRIVRPFKKLVCFHEDTPVHLLDGSVKRMADVLVDDVLEDGSVVHATMRLKGNSDDPADCDANDFYCIRDTKHGEDILVTASHLVYDPARCLFVPARDFPLAEHRPDLKVERLSCLITDTHRIQLGSIKFYDWDDPTVICSNPECKNEFGPEDVGSIK